MNTNNKTTTEELKKVWDLLPLNTKYDFFLDNDSNSEYRSMEDAISNTSKEETEEFISGYIDELIDSSDHDWLHAKLVSLSGITNLEN